ncbi:MAG TPA: phosphopantothenoylcysteine decarboxylase [Chthoniobacteraceae bacterium]|jgi:phosphopantothenoylcysteine synthetase/decarboxylase|nr:phosphopantothenoylcysteine decarboxylase [Chthoniobacteraceae bacterium]
MRVIVTCGPSYEPVDEVRRLTNFSTGELGTMLAGALVRAGFETICLRGVAATWPKRPPGADVRPFTTNDDLAAQLRQLGQEEPCAAFFHTAALADYRVTSIHNLQGERLTRRKTPTDLGPLTLRLEPASKILPQLRGWFPGAALVGWKYEVEGVRSQAAARAGRQIAECHTDACVLNGPTYGPGFGLLTPQGHVTHYATKTLLCHYLARVFLLKFIAKK